MTSDYIERNRKLDLAMLHLFSGHREKRSNYTVEYFIENDPRAHYEKRIKK